MTTTSFFARVSRLTAALAVALAAIAAMTASAACGEEDLRAQIARRYEAVNAELEAVIREMDCPPPLPDYPERVLSIRKNAVVAVGGEMRVNYIARVGNHSNPFFGPNEPGLGTPGRAKLADFQVSTVRLNFDVRAGDRWRARLSMNLDGFNGFHKVAGVRNPNAPGNPSTSIYSKRSFTDNLHEAYIEFLKGGHSGFGFKAGVMEMPFGLRNRPDLVGRSFLDAPDLTGSYLMDPLSRDNAVRLPHASRFMDPVAAAMIDYEMRDIIRFEAAIFQDRDGRRRTSRDAHGTSQYRTDSPPPLSWQAGFSILPLEGWELSADFRNRHSRSRGVRYWANSPYRWDFRDNLAGGNSNPAWDNGQWSDSGSGTGFGARSNEQAFAVGLAVEIPGSNLSVQAEYAHGWNQGFNKYINSDNVNLGLSYRLTPFLTLHGQAEWLFVRDKSWLVPHAGGWARDSRGNQLYRFLLGAEYEFFRGLTVEAGWQYEYWKATSAYGSGNGREDRVNTANMFYLGTRFQF